MDANEVYVLSYYVEKVHANNEYIGSWLEDSHHIVCSLWPKVMFNRMGWFSIIYYFVNATCEQINIVADKLLDSVMIDEIKVRGFIGVVSGETKVKVKKMNEMVNVLSSDIEFNLYKGYLSTFTRGYE